MSTGKKRPIQRIACVGEVMIELIARADGTARLGVAGDTYNTAAYLARALKGQNARVSYVTALGSDPYSDRIFQALSAHNLDTSFVERRAREMPGLYAIDTDDQGERSFSYWRSVSAARTLFSRPCAVELEQLAGFDLVFASGISLAILPADIRDRFIAFVDAFRTNGGTFAYDSNHRENLWASREDARDVNMRMWSRADIAMPSLDDEMLLFGDQDSAAVRARLAGVGATTGALKQGAQGPMDLSTGETHAPSGPPIKVVDSTAAGDSFNAGYMAALVSGKSAPQALLEGHNLAAHVVQHPGAIIAED